MPTISKRTKQARNLIIKPAYSLEEGVKLLKQTATTKFNESAEAHFNLNIDTNIKYNNYKTNKFTVFDSDIVLELKSSYDHNIFNIIENFPFSKRRFSKYSRGVLYLNKNRSNIINNN